MKKYINKKLQLEILDKISTLATAGFGLAAALAWNDAIKRLFQEIFGTQSNIGAMFLYAIIVTVIVVIVTMRLGKITNRLKEELGFDDGCEPDKNKKK